MAQIFDINQSIANIANNKARTRDERFRRTARAGDAVSRAAGTAVDIFGRMKDREFTAEQKALDRAQETNITQMKITSNEELQSEALRVEQLMQRNDLTARDEWEKLNNATTIYINNLRAKVERGEGEANRELQEAIALQERLNALRIEFMRQRGASERSEAEREWQSGENQADREAAMERAQIAAGGALAKDTLDAFKDAYAFTEDMLAPKLGPNLDWSQVDRENALSLFKQNLAANDPPLDPDKFDMAVKRYETFLDTVIGAAGGGGDDDDNIDTSNLNVSEIAGLYAQDPNEAFSTMHERGVTPRELVGGNLGYLVNMYKRWISGLTGGGDADSQGGPTGDGEPEADAEKTLLLSSLEPFEGSVPPNLATQFEEARNLLLGSDPLTPEDVENIMDLITRLQQSGTEPEAALGGSYDTGLFSPATPTR